MAIDQTWHWQPEPAWQTTHHTWALAPLTKNEKIQQYMQMNPHPIHLHYTKEVTHKVNENCQVVHHALAYKATTFVFLSLIL